MVYQRHFQSIGVCDVHGLDWSTDMRLKHFLIVFRLNYFVFDGFDNYRSMYKIGECTVLCRHACYGHLYNVSYGREPMETEIYSSSQWGVFHRWVYSWRSVFCSPLSSDHPRISHSLSLTSENNFVYFVGTLLKWLFRESDQGGCEICSISFKPLSSPTRPILQRLLCTRIARSGKRTITPTGEITS